ncbi:MAG TPA: hypothetical protein V6D48_20330 [Oculatellaceae cyanobacterium]
MNKGKVAQVKRGAEDFLKKGREGERERGREGERENSSTQTQGGEKTLTPSSPHLLPNLQSFLLVPFYLFLFTSAANALPGQSTEAVTAWINANPTLRPGIGDGLLVTKSETAAQRFTFQATVLAPGRVTVPIDRGTIRSERMSFYDQINGVTLDRLKESLRVIYGPAIYQDFDKAKVVYDYPVPETVDLARRQNLPLLAQQQGKLLAGERYAYWMEVTQTESGKAFNGQLTVFLKEDLDKLETELRDR